MTPPLRIGVLGCGAITRRHHLPSLRRIDAGAVVALADPDPVALAEAGRLAPGADAHDRADALLARPDVDAVVIAAPTHLHAELVVAAAAAGKHVYVEKPLAITEPQAERALDEVTRARVSATMGLNRRRHPLNVRAKELLGEGRIGEVRFVQTAFCEPASAAEMPAWRRSRSTGGGVLLDLGSHHFDLLRWLLDTEIEVVGAGTSSEESEQDGAWVRLATSAGADVQSLFSSRAAHTDVIELVGERGLLRIDRHRGTLDLTLRRRTKYGVRPAWSKPGLDVYVWRARRFLGRGGDPSYRRTMEAFVRRAGGEQVEAPSLGDGLRSLQAVLAAERLAATSEPE
jgi:myo-inositol 2-dehydrogenase / D-chiro-inositol 1-dehydrogenase